MEHESFEDEEIAELMNENFICIKVDREERPDLDEIYMNAVQAMTGSGGWPMTVFLTPDLKPFYAGTYFPPEDRYGRPGFRSVLTSVARFHKEQREKAESYSDQVASVLQQMSEFRASEGSVSSDVFDMAYKQLKSLYDPKYGGFGKAPKFPQAMSLSFLMRYWKRSGDAKVLEIVEHTLRKMAEGGMYDQLGGGFHRYSVDEKWLVPHFEKMLYDNALLSRVYLEIYQITRDDFYSRIASETLDYIVREMHRTGGGFYSTQDADTEGQEGKYYVWSLNEVEKILGENAEAFIRYYGLTKKGNFEHGENILHVPNSTDGVVQLLTKVRDPKSEVRDPELGMSVADLESLIDEGRKQLFYERGRRTPPGKDDKIITAWNALMISSMAVGHQILGNRAYLDAASQSAEFLLAELSEDGMLLRTYRNGGQDVRAPSKHKLNAYVEDYAFLIAALIDLYEADFQMKWLHEAIRLNQILMDEFWDEQNGGFFFTGDSHEELIVRSKSAHDGAIPSGNSVAAMNLLRLAKLTGDEQLTGMAETIFRLFKGQIEQSLTSFSQMLCALDFYLGDLKEIAIVGKRNAPETEEFIRTIHDHYIPNRILVFFDPDDDPEDVEDSIPLLKGRTTAIAEGKPVVYICENYVCKAPITDIELLKEALLEDKR
jgi:hypothetical protein